VRREDKGGITRVDTGVFNVLGNGVDEEFSFGSNSINIDFLGTINVLSNGDWVVGRSISSGGKLDFELLLGANDSHSGTREDVRWTDEDWVSNRIGKLLSLLEGSEFLPGWLINTDAVKDLRELLSVFGFVDIVGVSTENLGFSGLLQLQSNVLRKLTTDRDNDTASGLELINVHNSFVVQLLKVKLVGNIEIGAVRFWVV
jgi:hypothetical protein